MCISNNGYNVLKSIDLTNFLNVFFLGYLQSFIILTVQSYNLLYTYIPTKLHFILLY